MQGPSGPFCGCSEHKLHEHTWKPDSTPSPSAVCTCCVKDFKRITPNDTFFLVVAFALNLTFWPGSQYTPSSLKDTGSKAHRSVFVTYCCYLLKPRNSMCHSNAPVSLWNPQFLWTSKQREKPPGCGKQESPQLNPNIPNSSHWAIPSDGPRPGSCRTINSN